MITRLSHIPAASVLGLLLSAAMIAGCNGETATSPAATFSQTDLRAGTGAAAVAGSRISVHYTGWIYDAGRPDQKGLQFETNVGGTPFTFTLGAGQVIQGWDEGLVNLRVGGLRRLVIPPSMAYGSFRNGPIPPNASLVFEVELVGSETQ